MNANFSDSQSNVFFTANPDDYKRVNSAWGSRSYLKKIATKLSFSTEPITGWKW